MLQKKADSYWSCSNITAIVTFKLVSKNLLFTSFLSIILRPFLFPVNKFTFHPIVTLILRFYNKNPIFSKTIGEYVRSAGRPVDRRQMNST